MNTVARTFGTMAVLGTVLTLAAAGPSAAAPSAARPAAQNPRKNPAKTVATSAPPAAPSHAPVKVVRYDERGVAHLNTKLRYTTLIILPKEEVILDFVCGDASVWVINGEQNFAYVKPTQEGITTSLNLVTAVGHVYTFVLTEISGKAAVQPDLKVFVEPTDPAARETLASPRRLVSASELEESRKEAEAARAETERVKASAKEAVQTGVRSSLLNMRYPYRFEAGKKPFFIRAMSHDEHFTYIHARPEETPTLYEIRDGAPNLVSFSYENGMFVVQKVLESGYFALGKKRLPFKRED